MKDEDNTRTGGGGGGNDAGRYAAANNDGGARGGIDSAGGSSSSSSAGSPRQRPTSATAGGGGAPKPPPALPAPPPTAENNGPPATAPGPKGSAHSSSGSGSDNAGSGGTASSSGRSSGNAAVVTASAANNTTATSGSGSDDRSGSGRGDSGSGSGSNNRRSGGEASGEYYYAGYGSVASNQATVGSAPAQEVAGMPAVESFQGAPLAAAAAAAAAGPQAPQPGMPPQAGHVAVAADGGGLPPAGAFASHLRHHSRHPGHARQGLNQRPPPLPQAPVQAPAPQAPLPPAQPDAGIPRLPPSDEQAVLQRVPRTHATVVAGDVPPPPTSSDARSSASSGGGGRRRRRPTANAAVGQPMVASVRLANGTTVDSVNASGSSPTSSDSSQAGLQAPAPNYRHVTTMDPMLRKKIRLTKEAPPPPKAQTSLKRKLSAMNQGDSDGDAASSENGAATARDQVGTSVRSMVQTSAGGSDGGYAASSERQSGSSGSGSDSLSSDDANKGTKDAALAPHVPASDHVDHFRVGRWRTETSSMSSSVLADFSSSSVVHEGGPARNDSPCSSLSEEGAAAPARKRAREAAAPQMAPNDALKSGLSLMERSLQRKVRSGEHHHHRRHRKTLEESFLSAKRDLAEEARPMDVEAVVASKTAGMEPICADATIYALGQDVMAQVVSYLDPVEAHSFLTQPLSKAWLVTYAAPQELWKVLCASKPFCAKLDEGPGSSDASACGFPHDPELRHLFGRYRLLHASFVRCMRYLARLQDDAMNGRTPSVHVNAESPNDVHPYGKNAGLKAYFAKARRLARSNRSESSSGTSESDSRGSDKKRKATTAAGTAASDTAPPSSRRLGRSMLTDRLLRPTAGGDVDNVNLPWSCAIYSVVNWMVAFADVEGIQIMCLKCLPYLLEDESQRTTAQRAGLTDSVLRAMVLFPDSIELHTVAFHTLVLLARPLGGNEGMLFHTAMVNTRGIFNNGSSSGKNGIVIMLDSMRRFAQDEILQAMSCWSLVNVALTPLQKSMLVKLGGLTVTSNAMLQHPYNAEVQFRALFALINLVIPTEARPDETEEMRQFEREIFQQLGEAGDTSEKEMIDASVSNISNLVVVAMKNFCSSEAILNRACLVLHNLSLNEEYHSTLLWTPNCYQMLEWCLGNYPHDHVLQQSAGGTIQRLNATLSSDEELRSRFTQSIRAQQQHSLELARQEAVMLQEQESEQQQMQMDAAA